MKQYQDLLRKILVEGVEKESGRENMPNTFGISFGHIKMDMSDGFPLLTTKKMYWKGIVHELLWFLRGETNIKYLIDNNVNIWNGDAYRWYLKYAERNASANTGQNSILFDNKDNSYRVYSQEEFIKAIKENNLGEFEYEYDEYYKLGDLGKVYGYQWRNQNGIDQIAEVIKSLQTNPMSRYHIIDGWNQADFSEMALPPCHLLYQFICRPLNTTQRIELLPNWEDREQMYGSDRVMVDAFLSDIPKYSLDLNMYQRSCDTFLGVPFNIASMSLLLHIFAKTCNMIPGTANWIGGDTHIYMDHIPMVKEQLSRETFELCNLNIRKDLKSIHDILKLTIDDFEITNYKSHDAIKAELFTGLI